jgi:hypothetical protein
MDYILFLKADVTLQPNPEEIMVRCHRCVITYSSCVCNETCNTDCATILCLSACLFACLLLAWKHVCCMKPCRSWLVGVGTAWPTLPLTLSLLDGLQDTKYVSLQELRQMMEPGSGLLWSPWFRCGGLLGKGCRPFMCTTLTAAVNLAHIGPCHLGYLIFPPLSPFQLALRCHVVKP